MRRIAWVVAVGLWAACNPGAKDRGPDRDTDDVLDVDDTDSDGSETDTAGLDETDSDRRTDSDVDRPNQRPVGQPLTASTDEDTPLPLALTAEDAEGDEVMWFVGAPDPGGAVTQSGGVWTFEPPADASGTFSMRATPSDAGGDGLPVTVTVTVVAVDDPPEALPQSVGVDEDQDMPVMLGFTDVEGDAATAWTITQAPARGTLLGTPPALTYRPDPNVHGGDSFAFTVTAGGATSAPAQVDVFIAPVPDAPVGTDETVQVAEDGTLDVTLVATDADGDPLTLELVGQPTLGSVVLQGGLGLRYEGAADAFGTDTVQWKVTDGALYSQVHTLTVEVLPQPDAPAGSDVSVSLDEDGSALVQFVASDVDFDPLVYAVVAPPLSGVLSGSGDSRTYTPDPDFHGVDSFLFTVSDGLFTAGPYTATLTVASAPDAPRLTNPILEIDASPGELVTLPLYGDDPDGDPLGWILDPVVPAVAAQPAPVDVSGTHTWTAPATPGAYAFTWRLTDGALTSADGVVTVTVLVPPNGAPVAVNDSYVVPGHTSLGVDPSVGLLVNDSDPDSGPSALSVVPETITTALGGAVTTAASGGFSYDPPAGRSNVTDTFTYLLTDGADISVAQVSISVGRQIWYVDNTAPSGGDGRQVSPFSTLAEAAAAAGPNEILAVRTGSSALPGYDNGIVLQGGQALIGEGVDLVVDGFLVWFAGQAPQLGTALFEAVQLAASSKVEGIEVTTSMGSGLRVVGDGARIQQVRIGQGVMGEAIHVTGDDVFIEDVVVRGGSGAQDAIVATGVTDLTVRGLDASGVAWGVDVADSDGAIEIDGVFASVSEGAVRVFAPTTPVSASIDVLVRDVTVDAWGASPSLRGVLVDLGGQATIQRIGVDGVAASDLTDDVVFVGLGGNLSTRGPAGPTVFLDDIAPDATVSGSGVVVQAGGGAQVGVALRGSDLVLPGAGSEFAIVAGAFDGGTLWLDLVDVLVASPSRALQAQASTLGLPGQSSRVGVRLDAASVLGGVGGVGGTVQMAVAGGHHGGFVASGTTFEEAVTLSKAGSSGDLVMGLSGASLDGGLTLFGDLSSPPPLRLGSLVNQGTVLDNTDGGAIASTGNTTAGGPPTVVVSSRVELVDPASVVAVPYAVPVVP